MADATSANSGAGGDPRIQNANRLGYTIIILVFGGLIGWSVFAPISSAVIAAGEVRGQTEVQSIQHLEGGIISEILVSEGDRVEEGQILIRLDDTGPRAEMAQIESRLTELTARRARLAAEREGLEDIDFDRYFRSMTTSDDTEDIIAAQRTVFMTRRETRETEIEVMRNRIGQYHDRIAGLQAQYDSETRQLALIEEELVGLRSLYERGLTPRTRVLALEREGEALRGSRGSRIAEIAGTQSAIGQTEVEIAQLYNAFIEEVASNEADVGAQIAELRERRVAVADALERTEVASPSSGYVLGLDVHTLGGVVRPGFPLMQVSPANQPMVISARIPPTEIDRIAPGAEARIRFSTFQGRQTPEWPGSVLTISADRLVEPETGISYYLALIAMEGEGPDIEIVPGMPVEVFITSGSQSAIEYLLRPMTDRLARAFREE
ncbi:HlyD family type I secretion periplasmic adaptor subunit [Maricaulis salignorans]|uniref:Membrane fusion protein (MFP) family protein n=1 Tax=Maricaulis salignorans TaxID=144026 RepID=A0A1G9LWV8_9PROT|nr:HlyD family type I secretion periplasmic adaptor subunit [Maricaulis salignorans]SDL66530.1 membrane fusion protein, epimerase transport system [Maricaulis salignorans]